MLGTAASPCRLLEENSFRALPVCFNSSQSAPANLFVSSEFVCHLYEEHGEFVFPAFSSSRGVM